MKAVFPCSRCGVKGIGLGFCSMFDLLYCTVCATVVGLGSNDFIGKSVIACQEPSRHP